MAFPGISFQSPANGEANVYLNVVVKTTFSGALDSSTVSQETVTLTDTASNRSVLGAVTYDSSTYSVYFNPENYLIPNTTYRYTLVGSNDAISTPIKDSTGASLTGSLDYVFSAGTDIDQRDSERHKDSLRKSLEGDLALPVNIAVIGSLFTVSKFTPAQHASNVLETTTGFTVDFTKTLSTGDFSQSWATVSFFSLMDDDDYLAKTIAGSTVFYKDVSGSQASEFTDPAYSLSMTGTRLSINLSGQILRNQLVEIVLDKDIKSATGDTLANEDITWQFSTQLFPDLGGVRYIKREINAVASELNDDYISALIHKNTVMSWEMSGKKHSLGGLPKAGRNYAMLKTIIDILEDQELEKAMQAGIRRQLGDYMVSVDPNVIGKMAVKLSRAVKEAERALDTLRKESGVRIVSTLFGYSGPVPDRLWHGVNGRVVHNRFRYYQPNIPASNLALERYAEVPSKFNTV